MATHHEVRIAPSILAADFTRLGEEVRAAQDGGAALMHIDIMDGHFVPNLSMGPHVVAAVRRVTDLPLDVHLMLDNPDDFVERFADAGADLISVHVENNPNLYRTLQQIRDTGCKVGIAINPHTPVDMLGEVLGMVDMVNVMTVNPGFGGQTFLMSMQSKIARLHAMIGSIQAHVDIEVDGGITIETAPHAIQAGANILIAGTSVFEHPQGVAAGIKSLRQVMEID